MNNQEVLNSPFTKLKVDEVEKPNCVESRLVIDITHIKTEPHIIKEALLEIRNVVRNCTNDIFQKYGIEKPADIRMFL